jgi:DNA-binding CsgD family transcriptional regulator
MMSRPNCKRWGGATKGKRRDNRSPDTAAKLKITESTARTYAKRIYDKTGTQRQPELIRRFFETALPG